LKSRADDEIREISRQSQEFTSKLLQALIRNRNSETTGQILRLFLNGRFKASDVADIVDRLLPSLEQEEAAAVLSRAMPMLLPQLAAVRHDSVSSLLQHPAIEQAANMVGRTTLLNCFVPDGLNPVDADTQSSCLQLLLSTSTVRSLLLERCDEIARRIESRRFIPLTLDGFLCWAKLLDLAFEAKSSTAISGGAIALRHVFANKFLPASSVLVTAFPVIYKLLEKSKFIYELAETFDFFEWDKCKIMRQRLIESYSSADWPPSDLLICAYRSGILDDVISQIRNLNIFIRAKDMLKTNGSLEALKILEIAANSN
jgi:hemolysin-activating ACP:hemolysin acyltransferase